MKLNRSKFYKKTISGILIGLSLSVFHKISTPDVAVASPNWCTSSPDTITIGDGRVRQYVDISSACRGHDICYWTIGADKISCDNSFRTDLREICRQKFDSIPLRGQCNLNTDLYYKAVSGSGVVGMISDGIVKRSFSDAQREASKVANQLQERFPALDIKQYHQEIALQLATRQASGESVEKSIENTFNAIASRIPGISIEGTWSFRCCQNKYWGEFKLFQDGNKISGKFISSSNSTLGDINGTIQDNRVEFTRTWENKSQFYILNLSPNGQVLEGTFRGDQDPDTSIGVEFRATRQGSNNHTSLDGSWNDAWGTGAWRIEHNLNSNQFTIFLPESYARSSGRKGPYEGRFIGEKAIEVRFYDDPANPTSCCTATLNSNARELKWSNGGTWSR